MGKTANEAIAQIEEWANEDSSQYSLQFLLLFFLKFFFEMFCWKFSSGFLLNFFFKILFENCLRDFSWEILIKFEFVEKNEILPLCCFNFRDDGPITNFGASYVFERALRRYDIQAEQRKLQQNKYDSQLSKIENDNQALEYKLAKKETDFVRISDKCRSLQVFKCSFSDCGEIFYAKNSIGFAVFLETISWSTNRERHLGYETSSWSANYAPFKSRRWEITVGETGTIGSRQSLWTYRRTPEENSQ